LGFGEFHVVGAATEKPEKEKQLIGELHMWDLEAAALPQGILKADICMSWP